MPQFWARVAQQLQAGIKGRPAALWIERVVVFERLEEHLRPGEQLMCSIMDGTCDQTVGILFLLTKTFFHYV